MPGHDLIVIGTSAGGVEALMQLAAELPADFPAPIAAVIHLAPFSTSRLPEILNRVGKLRAVHPEDGAALEPGRILIAPPDRHLSVEGGHVRVGAGPRVNGHRPSVDVLFRSAARSHGGRTVGVILTGALDDGVAGLAAIRRRGGLAIVQDPEDAAFRDMPANALAFVGADHVVALAGLPALLARVLREPAEGSGGAMKQRKNGGTAARRPLAAAVASGHGPAAGSSDGPRNGTPSGFACPDCGGVLWQITAEAPDRFQCRIGHGYSPEALFAAEGNAVEDALSSALRALDERASLGRRMEERARARNQELSARRFGAQAEEAEARAAVLRRLLEQGRVADEADESPGTAK